jgi:gentisate 1,2-dioxygenase
VGIRPANWQAGTRLLRYPWAETRRALEAGVRATTTGIVEVEFMNPLTGGAVLPTMSCGMMLLEAGVARARYREVASTILLVFRGQGYSVINGERFSWEQGDVVAVPSWAWAEHMAERSPNEEPAILFTMTDRPALQALGLYRREEATVSG